ncbi:UNVERIFIED_CONTAM: hypothetical protein FKN15_072978 [Acipenser sinensis]
MECLQSLWQKDRIGMECDLCPGLCKNVAIENACISLTGFAEVKASKKAALNDKVSSQLNAGPQMEAS